jgi:ubiquitin carboxyl-terminal hydrolase 8
VNTVHVGKQINSRIRERAYGGSQRQHDSLEFLHFIIDILMDELNPTRNLPEWKLESDIERRRLNQEPSCLWAAHQFRDNYMANKTSILAQQTDIMEMSITKCNTCHTESRNYQNNPIKFMTVKPSPRVQSLVDAISEETGPRTRELLDFACETCNPPRGPGEKVEIKEKSATTARYHAWLPDFLWISLNRYGNNLQKLNTTFTFPETGIDLTATFAPDLGLASRPLPRQQVGPFLYDVYAVIQHGGGSIAHGHYWTLAKNFDKPQSGGQGAGAWHRFNDSQVSTAKFEETQTSNTSGIFLRRQGSYKPSSL